MNQNYVKVLGMEFSNFLKKWAQLIDKRLDEILGETEQEMGLINPELKKLFKEFIKASKGGKRIRGALVLLGYQISGGKDLEKVLDAAVAYEIFQTAILAQDDIIDKSLLRRGKPSLYAALGGLHRGISETLCLSDLGFFIANKLISELDVDPELLIRAIKLFSIIQMDTTVGQLLDVETPFLKRNFLESDSLKISLLKTARYTITGPLSLGATLGGSDEKFLKILQKFGDNLGIAFQIQDDILGIFGDEKLTGKSASSDIKECKATLLISFAQKKGSKEERGLLEKYYGDPEVDQKGIEAVKEVFIKTGALDYAQSQVEVYFKNAEQALKGSGQEVLYSLIEFIKDRKN